MFEKSYGAFKKLKTKNTTQTEKCRNCYKEHNCRERWGRAGFYLETNKRLILKLIKTI